MRSIASCAVLSCCLSSASLWRSQPPLQPAAAPAASAVQPPLDCGSRPGRLRLTPIRRRRRRQRRPPAPPLGTIARGTGGKLHAARGRVRGSAERVGVRSVRPQRPDARTRTPSTSTRTACRRRSRASGTRICRCRSGILIDSSGSMYDKRHGGRSGLAGPGEAVEPGRTRRSWSTSPGRRSSTRTLPPTSTSCSRG